MADPKNSNGSVQMPACISSMNTSQQPNTTYIVGQQTMYDMRCNIIQQDQGDKTLGDDIKKLTRQLEEEKHTSRQSLDSVNVLSHQLADAHNQIKELSLQLEHESGMNRIYCSQLQCLHSRNKELGQQLDQAQSEMGNGSAHEGQRTGSLDNGGTNVQRYKRHKSS